MTYEKLRQLLEEGDGQIDEMEVVDYLYNWVVRPNVREEPGHQLEYVIDDVLDVQPSFVKEDLLSIYTFEIIPFDEHSYDIFVEAKYVDVLSGAEPGKFAKTGIVLSIEGSIDVQTHFYDGVVYTFPFEVV